MDVTTVQAAGGSVGGSPQTQEVVAAPPVPATSSNAPAGADPPKTQSSGTSTLASVVAKLYNVPSTSGSGASQPELAISYKYVNQLQLVVTVFTNPQTGEEVAQFPPQELIGLAEFFDQIDGVTLDRKV
ncbi:MAG TPA: hypothetical protein VMA98_05960 [Candidatus Acidoferrales bacterium]|nr:hypothetical protein [Candidatus Acidoferrales bacterium]